MSKSRKIKKSRAMKKIFPPKVMVFVDELKRKRKRVLFVPKIFTIFCVLLFPSLWKKALMLKFIFIITIIWLKRPELVRRRRRIQDTQKTSLFGISPSNPFILYATLRTFHFIQWINTPVCILKYSTVLH